MWAVKCERKVIKLLTGEKTCFVVVVVVDLKSSKPAVMLSFTRFHRSLVCN